jgi:CTP:molybdopterin cytidylyltransferase MocA
MENNPVFVVLAGGQSKRMGLAKGLLKYQHTFWILEQLNRISKTSVKTVYIGLGFNYQHYFDAISWLEKAQNEFVDYLTLRVRVILNPNPELGSFSTLQSVLNTIKTNCDILINPIDVPILKLTDFNKIIRTENEVVIPIFNNKKGHPIKITSSFSRRLSAINSSDKNARLDFQIKEISADHVCIVEVNDRSVVKNINTKKDWISFLKEPI